MSADRLVVLVVADVLPHHLEQIRAVDPRIVVEQTTDLGRVRELAPGVDVIVGWNIPREVVRAAPRLRWIHSTAAGVDQLLYPEVTDGEMLVTSSTGIHAEPITEHVLGVGHIGRAIAARAKGFGMRVIGTRRTPEPTEHVDDLYPPDGLDEVLRQSDFVVIVLPLTEATTGLIGPRELRLMKPTAYLINVGRGGIVQEAALVEALRAGWIAGAGLDVFEREPLPPDSPLFALGQVILTPHVSGAGPRYYDRAVPLFCENLRRYLAAEPLVNVVDKRRGY